jgi:hypothetical protein
VSAHGANAAAAGIVAVLAELTQSIGRMIGDDLAVSLLEQSALMSSPRGMAVEKSQPTDGDRSRTVKTHD